mgnify:CR=1 FL=1
MVKFFDYIFKQWEKGRLPGKVPGNLQVRLLSRRPYFLLKKNVKQ